MRSNSKFKEFENLTEFKKWFNSLKITRKIDKLQVHHMDLPDYECWEQDKKRWRNNAALERTNSLDSFGKQQWSTSDGHGHYIAQHLNIFPNGHITTGRDINSTPIGIKGWNTGAICVEIYGDFDKGKDKMTNAQWNTVIGVYAIMADRLNIPINENHIRCHCWFNSRGVFLDGYYPSKSTKTCPGTAFTRNLVEGYGNTINAFKKYFYPEVKNFKLGEEEPKKEELKHEVKEETFIVRVIVDKLNVREKPDLQSDVVGVITNRGSYTIVATEVNDNITWGKLKSGIGYISLGSKYVERVK